MMIIDNNIPVRIAVTGATGRMGKEIIRYVIDMKNNKNQEKKEKYGKKIILGAVIARVGADICGMDVGAITNNSVTGVKISDNLCAVKDDFDVLIDFTVPAISIEYLKFCLDNNKNIVIGTTGFSQDHYFFIREASRKIGIVYSANFSIGVNVVLKLLNTITYAIGNASDINIIEMHHNKKIDIPSGTALMMQDTIVHALSSFVMCGDNTLLNNKDDINVKINDNEARYTSLSSSSFSVPIHSIRAGDCTGQHSVLFASMGENIQITHKACSRVIFVDGALRSAVWLHSKVGLFNMCDVLSI